MAGLGSALLWKADIPLWWIVAVVTGHFFLFCNDFLVWRRWELIWAAYLVAIVIWRLSLGEWSCFLALWYVLPRTALVILLQIRSPFYLGIFARQLNPRLDDFLIIPSLK